MKRIYLLPVLLLLVLTTAFVALYDRADVESQNNFSIDRMAAQGVLQTEPQYWHVLFDDFDGFPAQTATSVWDSSLVRSDANVATMAMLDSLGGGLLKITLPTNGKSNGMHLQANFMSFPLRRSWGNPDSIQVPMVYETRFMTREATQIQIVAGMTIEASDFGATVDGIVFSKDDQAATLTGIIRFAAGDSSYSTASLGTISKDTWYILRIEWNGRYARFYVNGVQKGQLNTRQYDSTFGANGFKPTFYVSAGDSVAHSVYLDYIKAKQRR